MDLDEFLSISHASRACIFCAAAHKFLLILAGSADRSVATVRTLEVFDAKVFGLDMDHEVHLGTEVAAQSVHETQDLVS